MGTVAGREQGADSDWPKKAGGSSPSWEEASAVERLDGGAPDADAGVGEPVVDAGEGHAGHADQDRLLHLRRVCRARAGSARARARRDGEEQGRELGRREVSHGLSKCWTSQSSSTDSASELRWPFFLLSRRGRFRQFDFVRWGMLSQNAYLAINACESFSATSLPTAAERALCAGLNVALTRDKMV